jgi:hypothetical protein
MCTRSFSPGVKCGRGVMLTNHPLLVLRLRKSRSYTSSRPNAPLWSVTGPFLHFFYCFRKYGRYLPFPHRFLFLSLSFTPSLLRHIQDHSSLHSYSGGKPVSHKFRTLLHHSYSGIISFRTDSIPLLLPVPVSRSVTSSRRP